MARNHCCASSSGRQEKLGHRLLPKFISVVDDPQAKEWKSIKLFGNYSVGNIFIHSENKLSQAALKEKLIELSKEDGLDKVYIVRKVLSRLIDLGGSTLQSLMSPISSGGAETALYPPVLPYKVSTKDGHEELCRGGSFANLSMLVLRDIEVPGDDETAYATIGASNDVSSIIAASALVKKIESSAPTVPTAKVQS